jgi:membrane-anchored protein YejM (alkaline phosphatase superfamily)
MIGWYHPYELLVGDHVDVVASSNAFHWLGEEPLQIGLQLYGEAARKILERSLLRGLSREALYRKNHAFVHNTEFVISHARSIIEENRVGQFAVLHIPVPHFPFCYSAEGQRPLESEYPLGSEDLAREQLAYTDRLIGELLDGLKRLGKYERATIVLTSDHTWRNDPELRHGSARHWSHVPLLIKFPGQKERIEVDAPFTTSRLERLLDAVRKTGYDISRLRAILEAESFHVAIADEEADLTKVMPLLK